MKRTPTDQERAQAQHLLSGKTPGIKKELQQIIEGRELPLVTFNRLKFAVARYGRLNPVQVAPERPALQILLDGAPEETDQKRKRKPKAESETEE
jgi:hypothetical protein